MVLFYERINWENFPSIVTPINEINLNKIDYAAKTLDERTVELYNTKAEKAVVLNTVQDWSLDEDSGIITITKVNGEQIMFDLNIEKIPVKFELSEDGILIMTTDDGSKFTANIGAMIPVIVFENSDTISVTKISNRTELATNFSKYVHEFESAFTGNIVVKVVPLGDSTGQYNATLVYENGTMDIKSGGGVDEEEFVFAVESLSKITVSSLTSNNIVALYAEVVTNEIRYRFDVKDGSIKDKHLEPNYLAKIKVQAENAELSATASAESATTASEKAIVAESYAVGGTGTRDGENTDNAKYYSESVSGAVGDIVLNRQTLGYVKKNLLKNKGATTTKNGVTFTVNDDGSVTVNGTPTVTTYVSFSIGAKMLPAGKYIINGCPTGGAHSKYAIEVSVAWAYDYGTGKTFTLKEESTVYTNIIVWAGTTIDNLTFYPMIRSADITDDTYEPYVDDVNTRLEKVETEVIPIERGGTGATTVREAEYNIHSDIEERTYTLTDDLYTICLRKEPNATNGTFVKIKLTLLWNYIKTKAESIFATKTEVTPVANLITTVAGKPLDATMGKELADRLTTVESNLAEGKVKFQVTEDGTLQYSVYTEDA